MRLVAGAVLAAALLARPALAADPAQPSSPDTWVPRTTAELVVLEKQRAQPTTLTLSTGQSATSGTLTITLKGCDARPPDLPPNSAAFLEVTDTKMGAAPVFRGWLLANTPAVSQVEHPIYDIRLVACR